MQMDMIKEGRPDLVDLNVGDKIEVLGTGSVSANHLKKKWEVLDVIDLHQPSSDYVEEIAFSVADNPLLLHKLNQFILSLKDYQI